jgi:hypothetical protein
MKKLTPLQQTALKARVKKLEDVRSKLRGRLFPEQLAFIDDQERFKAAYCARRAGKTVATMTYLVLKCFERSNATGLFLARSRSMAEGIVMRNIFTPMMQAVGLQKGRDWDVNMSKLQIQFTDTGSVIQLMGADADRTQQTKFLGQQYDLVILDESSTWKADLNTFVFDNLFPATMDAGGTICMIGVPDNNKGFFYHVTRPENEIDPATLTTIGELDEKTGEQKYSGWSVHHWLTSKNPFMGAKQKQQIDLLIKKFGPCYVDTPAYKQSYLGEWVFDPEARCFRFDKAKNWVAELPGPKKDYVFVIGVDQGFTAPSAFVSLCWKADGTDPNLYVVDVEQFKEMLPDDIGTLVNRKAAEVANGYYAHYIIDAGGGGKTTAEDLKRRLHIPFEDADKKPNGIVPSIKIIDGEMRLGKIKFVVDACQPLLDEMDKLVWSYDIPWDPQPSGPADHCCDALRYAFQVCTHFNQAPPPPPREPTMWEPGYAERRQEQYLERLRASRDNEVDRALDGVFTQASNDDLDHLLDDKMTRGDW